MRSYDVAIEIYKTSTAVLLHCYLVLYVFQHFPKRNFGFVREF